MKGMGTIEASENTRKRPVRAVINKLIQAVTGLPMLPSQRVRLHRFRGVSIGKDVFIGAGVLIDDACPEKVIIEDKVTVLARTIILAHATYPNHFQNVIKNKLAETRICEGAYVGVGAIILPGITIGKYSIIGAGSVVTKDIPEYSKAVGVPAQVVGEIDKALIL